MACLHFAHRLAGVEMNLFSGSCKRFRTDFSSQCGASQGTFERLQTIARGRDD
jgi:hypothetical protein